MTLEFAPPIAPTVEIAGSTARFPVHRIYCVGRNYAAHAREMGMDSEREPPFFFSKPADAVVANGAAVPYPPRTANLHHEIELVVAIGEGGRDIPAGNALAHVFGYAVGNDLTRLLNQTDKLSQQRKDQYISSELFVLAAVEDKGDLGRLLREAGASKGPIERAIEQMRGGQAVSVDPLAGARVLAVSRGADGTQLELAGVGSRAYTSVKQIL